MPQVGQVVQCQSTRRTTAAAMRGLNFAVTLHIVYVEF